MADATQRSILPLIRADHFDAAMKTARRSVSPQDVLKYQEFARTLAQWRGLPSTHASVYVPSTYLHTSTPPLSFLQAGCPSCRPTNGVEALKASSCSTSCDRQTDRQTDGRTNGWHMPSFHLQVADDKVTPQTMDLAAAWRSS